MVERRWCRWSGGGSGLAGGGGAGGAVERRWWKWSGDGVWFRRASESEAGGAEMVEVELMLEDSVKKLETPKSSPGQTLTKAQIDSSLELLANWVYENCGSVSFSSLEHPKFKNFLNQIGLPAISRRDLVGERLDSRYKEAKTESEARIHDALFFQISSDGWKSKSNHHHSGEIEKLVNLSVNLPNGTSVFRRGAFIGGYVFSKYADNVLWETICDIFGSNLQQCVGIVSDNLQRWWRWMAMVERRWSSWTAMMVAVDGDGRLQTHFISTNLSI